MWLMMMQTGWHTQNISFNPSNQVASLEPPFREFINYQDNLQCYIEEFHCLNFDWFPRRFYWQVASIAINWEFPVSRSLELRWSLRTSRLILRQMSNFYTFLISKRHFFHAFPEILNFQISLSFIFWLYSFIPHIKKSLCLSYIWVASTYLGSAIWSSLNRWLVYEAIFSKVCLFVS